MDAPEDLERVRRDLGRAMALLKGKSDDYVKARDYYTGKRAEVHANPVIAALLTKSAQAHPLALAHIPVDALLDRVDLTSVAVAGGGQAALDKLLDETGYIDEVDDWHTKAGYFGDYYVMLDPIEEDDDGNAGRIELIGASPLTTVVVYDQRTEREAIYGARVWHESDAATNGGGEWHASVFYDDCTVHLQTGPMTTGAEPKAGDFFPSLDDEGDEGSERVPHAGGVMLLEHFPIDGKPYGRPLHSKAYGPQDALTKLNATALAAVDGAGFPLRYALLHEGAEIDDDDADDDFGDDFTAAPSSGSGSKVKADPGSIAFLRGVKSAGTFEGAKPDGFLSSQDWHVRAMAVATGTPIFEFDAAGEQPSGEARRRAEARIVRHAQRVVRDLTAAHRRLTTKLLALRGIVAEDVTITFAPLETSTDAEGMALVASKIAAGIPPRKALLEAGYTSEDVDEWFPEGETAALPIEAVVKLAPALAALGQAVTLGALTPDEAAALLPRFLTGARGEGPLLPTLPPAAPPEVVEPEPEA